MIDRNDRKGARVGEGSFILDTMSVSGPRPTLSRRAGAAYGFAALTGSLTAGIVANSTLWSSPFTRSTLRM